MILYDELEKISDKVDHILMELEKENAPFVDGKSSFEYKEDLFRLSTQQELRDVMIMLEDIKIAILNKAIIERRRKKNKR